MTYIYTEELDSSPRLLGCRYLPCATCTTGGSPRVSVIPHFQSSEKHRPCKEKLHTLLICSCGMTAEAKSANLGRYESFLHI